MGIFNIYRKGVRFSITMDIFKKTIESPNPGNLTEAKNWLETMSSKTMITPQRLITADRSRLTNIPLLGRMYLFNYDPKYKKELPYYDRFPLIFPFVSSQTKGLARQGEGFYGINLHYLSPMLRAYLMDLLMVTVTNNKLDETTKLKISYRILDQSSKLRLFRPCVKHYLISQMRSKFFMINADEWKTALILPLQRFIKAPISKIYKDSLSKVRV